MKRKFKQLTRLTIAGTCLALGSIGQAYAEPVCGDNTGGPMESQASCMLHSLNCLQKKTCYKNGK